MNVPSTYGKLIIIYIAPLNFLPIGQQTQKVCHLFSKLYEEYLYSRECTTVALDWSSLTHCLLALSTSSALKQCAHPLRQTLID